MGMNKTEKGQFFLLGNITETEWESISRVSQDPGYGKLPSPIYAFAYAFSLKKSIDKFNRCSTMLAIVMIFLTLAIFVLAVFQ